FWIYGKFKPRKGLLRGAVALTGLQVQETLGINVDRIGFDGGGGGNGAGNDLALYEQALDARVDEAGAELGEIKDTDHQGEQPRHVQKNDAARQAREADPDEQIPGLQQKLGYASAPGRP